MNIFRRIIKCFSIMLVLVLLACTGCAEAKRSRIIQKTRVNECDLSEMGKNKYFHSNHYKRIISHSTRKIHRR